MDERQGSRARRGGDGAGWEEIDLRFDSLRQLETDFVRYLASDGLYVPTIEPLAPSSVVRLRLLLPDDFVLLEGTGVVFWVRRADESGPVGLPPGMAVRFAALGQQHQDMVDRLIRSFQERGGHPFDLDQAVAATDGTEPAPPTTRARAPEVARLQVRGGEAPTARTSAPPASPPETDDGPSHWSERTISLGVPPLGDRPDVVRPAAPPEIPEDSGPVRTPGGPSVDETLEIAWARVEAGQGGEAGESDDDGPPTTEPGGGSRAAEPIQGEPPSREAEAASTSWPPPPGSRETEETGPRIPPVVLPDPAPGAGEAGVGDDEGPRGNGLGSARLIYGLAGLAVVAVVAAVALAIFDPLGWRSRVEDAPAAVGRETHIADDAGEIVSSGPAEDGESAEGTSPGPQGAEGASAPDAALPPVDELAPTGPNPDLEPTVAARRVVEIVWQASPGATAVLLTGDGRLDDGRVRVERLADPPRVLIRLVGIEEEYPRYILEAGTPELLRIRTGFHPELRPSALYVVLDLPDDSGGVLDIVLSGATARVTVGRTRP